MMGLIALAYASALTACWAWDSRSLHKKLAALEIEVHAATSNSGISWGSGIAKRLFCCES